ncbi:hypothetical protein [Bacillus sp. 2205SS5-2]|uniref:hypothetical protein n=1 Tax=Bacillus sp. 2205SS5-2 TaxID=3109031 RepID=UPI0030058ACA
MHKELLYAFMAFFVLSLNVVVVAYAVENQSEKGSFIDSWEIDVTGDGVNNKVTLYGLPYDEDSPYFKEVWSTVQTASGENLQIDYKPGYEPTLQFEDLNHDLVLDIFYSSPTGGSGGLSNYALHTTKDNEITDITIPKPLHISGEFQENYQAQIDFLDTEQSFQVDLSKRKEDYGRLGIYKNGKLLKPTKLMIAPYSFLEIVEIKDKKGKGLKGSQQISGAYNADSIGLAQSFWFYEEDSWSLQKAKWKPYKAD